MASIRTNQEKAKPLVKGIAPVSIRLTYVSYLAANGLIFIPRNKVRTMRGWASAVGEQAGQKRSHIEISYISKILE